MNLSLRLAAVALSVTALTVLALAQPKDKEKRYLDPINLEPPPVVKDKGVKYDYDIVYVRAPRRGDKERTKWAEVGDPRTMEAGADLMLLHPDGKEEVLVAVEKHESIADPFVSFDGQSVYYAKMHDALGHKGSDIYRIHVPTRKIVKLTNQTFTPNTGAADWSKTPLPRWGVYNLGPTPVPGGKIAFVSDRNAFKGTNTGYAPNALALQLFVMDEDGSNVDCIGHLNLGMALHPVILKDGRIMFSSLESQSLRSHHLWGIWAINPDGSNWSPLVSAFDTSNGTTDSFHFQTQLTDESIVYESYYNLNNFGFGLYFKQPITAPDGYPPFGPGYKNDPRNPPLRNGRLGDGRAMTVRFPFSPHGIETLTPFIARQDTPAEVSVLGQKDSPRVGKYTHPSGAPDNHMLTTWASGPVNGAGGSRAPALNSGIYLIKDGKPIDEPGQMLLVKNDPNYNEQWPRALVPYKRIYGIDAPPILAPVANDGKKSKHLPEGTPLGLVGTSSLYKRESYPYGVVPEGKVTATFAETKDSYGDRGLFTNHNWRVQGADAGLYSNDDVHAIRILLLEPNTEREGGPKSGRLFYNHAHERMRILGEFPVRKFDKEGKQPTDPDGNPDTSFLAKIPADVAWTFQTLDRNSMVLNMAQTWHQIRPGEIRNDCGGCHAHSQKPTDFTKTYAAREDYAVVDLTKQTPILTDKKGDKSGKKWDTKDETGVRFESGPKTVEYHRDIKPILERSCVVCHSGKLDKPAAQLVLDDDKIVNAENPVTLGFTIKVPGTYKRLAADAKGEFGIKPLHRHGWHNLSASRYVRAMQSRRSLLIWKIYGERLDGFKNDDFVHETIPGDPNSLQYQGKPIADSAQTRERLEIAYVGSAMPPPEAVKSGKVQPLTDEDRRTFVRWVDLGCPIDLDYDAKNPDKRGYGWQLDDQRPTLALTYPKTGTNGALTRIVVGMHDYDTGLNAESFSVTADFEINGIKPGENLASKFKDKGEGVRELTLSTPIKELKRGTLIVSIKDKQGNATRIERVFSVSGGK